MKRMKPKTPHVKTRRNSKHKTKRHSKRSHSSHSKGGMVYEGDNVTRTTVGFAEDNYEDAKWWFWFWIILNWLFGFAIFFIPIIFNFTSYAKMKKQRQVYRRVKELYEKQQAERSRMAPASGQYMNPMYQQPYGSSSYQNMQQGQQQPHMQQGQQQPHMQQGQQQPFMR